MAGGCDVSKVSAMPPDLAAVVRDLKARVDSLERAQPQAATPVYPTGLTWSAPTGLPIRSPRDFRVESLWADTPAAVGSDTTWELRRNGTAVGSVTIVSGDTHGHADLDPPVVGDIFDVFTVAVTAGSSPATVRALGRSSSPDSPAVGITSARPSAWCASGVVEGGTDPGGATVTGPDTSAHTADWFLVLVAVTIVNATGGAATPSLTGYIKVDSTGLSSSPWQLPQQAMANSERIVATLPCLVAAGDQVDFYVADANTSGTDLTVGITVIEVDALTGACCTAPA